MNIKRAVITCIVVVLYLSFCSWRFQKLDEDQAKINDTLVINVNH